AGTSWSALPRFLLLLLATSLLYSAGMIWNDFFDLEQDRRERPFRPIPSGRIARARAGWLGGIFLLLGVLSAWSSGTGAEQGGQEAALLGALLAFMVLAYDAYLKRTWVGPIAMGMCRSLNVLLGLSVADTEQLPWGLRIHVAVSVGVYIAGVTWFARKEASTSQASMLRWAWGVMLLGLASAIPLALWFPEDRCYPLYLWGLIGVAIWVSVAAL